MVRISIVDDHSLVRNGLILILNRYKEFEIVHQADDGLDILQSITGIVIDVMILDLNMKFQNGIVTCEQIKESRPEIKVLACSMFNDKLLIAKMALTGADGYIVKNADPPILHRAITTLANGGYYYMYDLKTLFDKDILLNIDKYDFNKNDISLSNREIEIIKLICEQKTTAEIADRLNVSIRTIDAHRYNIMEKTESKNVVGIVLFAAKNQLI